MRKTARKRCARLFAGVVNSACHWFTYSCTRPSGPVRFFQLIAGEKNRSVRFSSKSLEVKRSIRPSASPLEAATAFLPAGVMRL